MSNHHGFKKITLENWKDSDFADFGPIFSNVSESSWVNGVLRLKLCSQVPSEVAALFEVARGAVIYAWFFYPLMTLGVEQLHRVREAAVRLRCQQAGIPIQRQHNRGRQRGIQYADLINSLITAGIIPKANHERWDAARRLRNMASHPDSQQIWAPGMVLTTMETLVNDLNALFA